MKRTAFFKTGIIKNQFNPDEIIGYTWENKNGYAAITGFNSGDIYEPDGTYFSGIMGGLCHGEVLEWLSAQEKYCIIN